MSNQADINLDDFVRGYVECGLFCTIDDSADDYDPETGSGGSLSDNGYSYDLLDTDTLISITEDLTEFAQANADDLEAYCEAVGDWSGPTDSLGRSHYSAAERAGHDLWYSRGGHGTGFWDQYKNGAEELGRRLHDAAGLSEPYLYALADGRIYS